MGKDEGKDSVRIRVRDTARVMIRVRVMISIKFRFSKALHDLYIQEWHTKVTASSKGKNYNFCKTGVIFENYLDLCK